jgi:hypothetical protein
MSGLNRTTDIDRGRENILKVLEEVNNSFVTIGIHEGAGKYPTTEEQPDPPLISEVAIINEFGSSDRGIPERSFVRSTMDENRHSLHQETKVLHSDVLLGKITTKKALDKLGFKIQTLIQNKIKTLRTPPNSQETIDKKKADNPLIDSQLMMRSVNFKTHIKGK